jgi:hypothetical protein
VLVRVPVRWRLKVECSTYMMLLFWKKTKFSLSRPLTREPHLACTSPVVCQTVSDEFPSPGLRPLPDSTW